MTMRSGSVFWRALSATRAVSLKALLMTLTIVAVGCTPYGAAVPDAGDEAETTREKTSEEKAPPFFIYRPGAGLTIEDAQGKWGVRL